MEVEVCRHHVSGSFRVSGVLWHRPLLTGLRPARRQGNCKGVHSGKHNPQSPQTSNEENVKNQVNTQPVLATETGTEPPRCFWFRTRAPNSRHQLQAGYGLKFCLAMSHVLQGSTTCMCYVMVRDSSRSGALRLRTFDSALYSRHENDTFLVS